MDDYIQGYEACFNEINNALNGAVAYMDEQKSAKGTLDAFNMIITRVHILKSTLDVLKNAHQN